MGKEINKNLLKMAKEVAASALGTIDTMEDFYTPLLPLKNSIKKFIKDSFSVIFNETCLKESLLPKYTSVDTDVNTE